MSYKLGQIFTVQRIDSNDQNLKNRMLELGFFPGLEIKLINRVSFGAVYIVQFNQNLIALNQNEFSCLQF
jgi:Fe2+ transport system protein FeoA